MNESILMEQGGEIVADCVVPESLDRRWYLVAVLGTSLSIISIVANIIIAKVLLNSKHGHFFFLALLALSDCFLSLNYGPVIAMDIIKDRLQFYWLTKIYMFYVGPLLALCQTSMTFSCYLIILATVERYLITQKTNNEGPLNKFRRIRGLLAFLMFMLALMLRAPILFEVDIKYEERCVGTINEYFLDLAPIVETFWYGHIYRFYIRNIMTVLVPFVLLAILNYKIVMELRRQERAAQMFRLLSSDRKTKVRSATLLMVFVVCSYLIANVLNVIITLWEYISFTSTQDTLYTIYETCTDVTSVLYIFVCATRLFVYYLCNKEIRDEIKELVSCSTRSHYKEDFVTVTTSFDSSRQVGTEFDAVVIAIARRLWCNEMDHHKQMMTQSFVIANQHVHDHRDGDEDDYDDDEDPHMV